MSKFSNTIEYNIKTNLDASGLNKLQQQINIVSESFSKLAKKNQLYSSEEYNADIQRLSKVQKALSTSFNNDLNVLDISKFSASLNGLPLSEIQKTMSKTTEGAEAFDNILMTIGQIDKGFKNVSSVTDKIMNTFGNTVRWGITASIFQTIQNSLYRSVDYVKELDTSLNNIQIVTGASSENMRNFSLKANEAAANLGASTVAFTDAAQLYAQNGYSEEDYTKLAELTTKVANVTQQSTSDVSEQITSLMAGYKMSIEEADDALSGMAVVAAESASDLGELANAEQKVASAANTLGVSQDQLTAQLSTIISVTREAPETIGNSLKTIYARLGDLKLGKTLEDNVNLGKVSNQLQGLGVQILDTNGDMRAMGDILEDLMGKWKGFSAAQQQAAAVALAGKYQYNNFMTLMSNSDMYYKQKQTYNSSKGALDKQQDIYMESLQAKIQKLQTTWEGFVTELVDSNNFKGAIDGLSDIIKMVTDLTDSLGGVQPILTIVSSLMLRTFSKNIAAGYSNMMQNSQRKNILAQNDEEIAKMFDGQDLKGAGGQFLAQTASVRSSLTGDQAEGYLTQVKNFIQADREAREAHDAFNKSLEETAKSLEDTNIALSQYGLQITKDGNVFGSKVNDYNRISAQIQINESQATEFSEAAGRLKRLNNSKKRKTKNEKSLSARNIIHDTFSTEELEDTDSEIGQIYKQLLNVRQKVADMDALVEKAAAIANQRSEKFQEASSKLKRENPGYQAVKKAQEEVERLKEEEERAGKNVESSDARQQQAEKDAQTAAERLSTQDKIKQYINAASAIGQLSFAVQGLQNLGSIWQNDDIATGDKILQTIMSFSITVPQLVSSFKNLFDVYKNLSGTTQIFSAVGKVFTGTFKKNIEDGAGLFQALKGSIGDASKSAGTFGTSLTALVGPLGVVAAALAAIGIAFVAISAHDNAIDELAEKQQKIVDSNKEVSDSTNQTLKDWDNLYNQYRDTGDITDEFAKSSSQVAESLGLESAKALEAAGNYDALAQAIRRKQDADNQATIDSSQEAMQGGLYQKMTGQKILGRSAKGAIGSALYTARDGGVYNQKLNQLDVTDLPEIIGVANSALSDYRSQLKQLGSSYEEAQKNGFSGDKKAWTDEVARLNNAVEHLSDTMSEYSDYTDDLATAADARAQQSDFQAKLSEQNGDLEGIHSVYESDSNMKAYLDSLGDDYESYLKFVLSTAQDEVTQMAAQASLDKLGFAQESNVVEKSRGASDEKANAKADEIYQKINDMHLSDEDVIKLRASIDYDTLKNNADEIIERLNNGEDLDSIVADITVKKPDNVEQYGEIASDAIDNTKIFDTADQVSARLEDINVKQEDFEKYRDSLVATNDEFKNFSDNIDNNISELQKQAGAIKDSMKSLDKNSDEYKDAENQLDDLNDQIADYQDALDDAASKQLECETGAKELADSWDDNVAALDESNRGTKSYIDALNDMSEGVGHLLNIDMSSWSADLKDAFITDNLDQIKAAIDGDTDALQNLKLQAEAMDIVIDMGLDPNVSPEITSQVYDILMEAQNIANDNSIEAGAYLDDSAFTATLTNMLLNMVAAGQDISGVLANLADMGIEVEQTTKEVNFGGAMIVDGEDSSQYTGTMEIPSFRYKKIGNFNQAPKTYSSSGSGSSKKSGGTGGGKKGSGGGGKGSGSSYTPKTKDKQEDEYDRYEKVNAHLDRLSKTLDKLADAQDRLTGKKLADNMAEQAAILEQQVKWQKEKLELQQQEASELQGKLVAYGVQFDSEGYISNYKEAYYAQLNKYNSAIDAYNADGTEAGQEAQDKIVEQAKKSYDDFKDLISEYDDLRNSTIEESLKNIEDYYDKIEDLRINAFKKSVEAVDDMKDMRETLIDFNAIFRSLAHDTDFDEPFNNMATNAEKLKQYWDMDKIAMNGYYDELIKNNKEAMSQSGVSNERKNWLISRNQMYENAKNNLGNGTLEAGGTGYLDMEMKNLNDIMEQINQFETTGTSSIFGENSADLYDVAKSIFESATSMAEDLKSEMDDLKSNIIDGIGNIGDAIDKQLDKFDNINDTLEHYADMIEMVSGDQAYDKLNAVYEAQIKNGSAELDTLKASIGVLEDLQKTFEEGSDQWNEVADQIADKQSQVLDKTKDIMDLMNQVYSNNVSKQLDNWLKDTPLGADLDWMSDQWELINRNEDQYLDKTNSAYNIQKLQAKYLDLLDQSDNLLTQQKITDQMNQQLNMLRSKNKLSQYDVDYANAQLEILQKTIALQDAQNNKSQMKLRRDTQGNYSYVYTANEGDVKNAQSDLLDAQNNAYNLSKDQIKQTQDDSLSALQDAKSMISDIWTNANLTLEEKTDRTKTIIASLKEYLAGTADQLSEAEQNIIQDFIGMCEMMTDENKSGLDDVYDQIINGNDEAFSQIDSRWGDSISQWLGNLDQFNQATDKTFDGLIDNAKDYADKTQSLGEQVGLNFSDMTDAINAAKTATDDLAASTSGFIDKLEASSGTLKSYEKQLDEYKSRVLDLNNAMGEYQSKVNNLESSLQAEQRKNADLSDQLAASEAKYNAAYGNNGGSGSGGGAGGVGGSSDDVAYGIAQSIWTFGQQSGWGNNPIRSDKLNSGYGSDFAKKVQDIINQKVWSGSATDLVNYDSMSYSSYNLLGYDTGGYTGTWSETEGLDSDAKNGKLAILHQKELVLNETDTANILKAVEYVREMAQEMSSNGIMADLADRYNAWSTKVSEIQQSLAGQNGNIDQTVNVNAEFPNATSAEEIKTALNDLANAAIQYTGKRIGRYGLN